MLGVTQLGEVLLHPSLGVSKPVASPFQVPREDLRTRQLSVSGMTVPAVTFGAHLG